MRNKDYLSGTSIFLRQRSDMFRCNTDTALLGHFMKVTSKDTVLDIGCNNGALMLYASQYNPIHLYGVDLFEEAIALAQENLKANHIERFTLFTQDVVHLDGLKTSVIVCNPPYFDTVDTGHRNMNPFLETARHEKTLTLETLMMTAERLLQEEGRFYLVHRASRIPEIIQKAEQTSLQPKTMQIVFDENKEEATAVLMELIRGYKGKLHVMKPKIIQR